HHRPAVGVGHAAPGILVGLATLVARGVGGVARRFVAVVRQPGVGLAGRADALHAALRGSALVPGRLARVCGLLLSLGHGSLACGQNWLRRYTPSPSRRAFNESL